MDDLQTLLDQLEDRELDYVWERSKTSKDKPAYEGAGISRSTWYGWDETRRQLLNDIAMQLKRERLIAAQKILTDHVVKAAQLMSDQLESKNERVAQSAARDIMDRTMGQAEQNVKVVTPGPLVIRLRNGDNAD